MARPQTHLKAVVETSGEPDGTAIIRPLIEEGLKKLEVAEKERRIAERGKRSACLLWPFSLTPDGYAAIWVNGERKYAHREAFERWYGEKIPEGMVACHRCDTPACINPFHIFIGTHADNMRDKTEKGRQARGEKNGMAKLTWDNVREIRSTMDKTQRELAAKFGVSESLIYLVRKGAIWVEDKE